MRQERGLNVLVHKDHHKVSVLTDCQCEVSFFPLYVYGCLACMHVWQYVHTRIPEDGIRYSGTRVGYGCEVGAKN